MQKPLTQWTLNVLPECTNVTEGLQCFSMCQAKETIHFFLSYSDSAAKNQDLVERSSLFKQKKYLGSLFTMSGTPTCNSHLNFWDGSWSQFSNRKFLFFTKTTLNLGKTKITSLKIHLIKSRQISSIEEVTLSCSFLYSFRPPSELSRKWRLVL